MKRLKRVVFSGEALLSLCIEDTKIQCVKGLPTNTEIRGVSHDYTNNTIAVFIEHESFDGVEEFNQVPEVHVEFQLLRDEPCEDK